jgi:hypothetical protein
MYVRKHFARKKFILINEIFFNIILEYFVLD